MNTAHYISRVRDMMTRNRTAPTALVGPEGPRGAYTGRPSLAHQIFVTILGLIQPVVNADGASEALVSDAPPWYVKRRLTVRPSEFAGMPTYTLQKKGARTPNAVLYLHGGGYTAQPLVFQWLTIASCARQTGATFIVPMYPLAGRGGSAETVVPAMADLMSFLVDDHGAENVSVLGDSAGGGLALAAVQELVRRGNATPGSMVLLSPWLDVTLSDPLSRRINDPMLVADALVAGGALWADTLDPAHPWVSPLFGSLAGIPPTTVYSGSRDLLTPDTLRLQRQSISDGAPVTFGLRKDLIHCWQIFSFLPEAHADRRDIYRALNLG